jgi:hypothetical protein
MIVEAGSTRTRRADRFQRWVRTSSRIVEFGTIEPAPISTARLIVSMLSKRCTMRTPTGVPERALDQPPGRGAVSKAMNGWPSSFTAPRPLGGS